MTGWFFIQDISLIKEKKKYFQNNYDEPKKSQLSNGYQPNNYLPDNYQLNTYNEPKKISQLSNNYQPTLKKDSFKNDNIRNKDSIRPNELINFFEENSSNNLNYKKITVLTKKNKFEK